MPHQAAPLWGADLRVVIAGLTNSYSGYITTWEEYQTQRFEGAATAYGPYTLDAYIQVYTARLVLALLSHGACGFALIGEGRMGGGRDGCAGWPDQHILELCDHIRGVPDPAL